MIRVVKVDVDRKELWNRIYNLIDAHVSWGWKILICLLLIMADQIPYKYVPAMIRSGIQV